MNVPACAKPRCHALSWTLVWLFVSLSGCPSSTERAPSDAGPAGTLAFAPDKGPAHSLPLPVPGEQEYLLLDGDDTWRYVAPEKPGRLYDASYFDGRYFVLHGLVETSGKAVTSEQNFLSWSRDGLTWQTLELTSTPFESYTRLASNGQSLLLAGVRHVARFEQDSISAIDALEQNVAAPVILAYPSGYALARMNDIVWLDNQGHTELVLEQPLAQFRAGVAREPGQRSVLAGPFGALQSRDGKKWTALDFSICSDCIIDSMTFGNERYLAADSQNFFVSSTAEQWQKHVFEPAQRSAEPSSDPLAERGEDLIARVDFTGGHFFALTQGGNLRVSRDGSTWSEQLEIPLGQIGPAACLGRCVIAAGRIVRPPIALTPPEPPPGAESSSPYYCEYMALHDSCSACYGATVASCREGVTCRVGCKQSADCPAAMSGKPRIECSQTNVGGLCTLYCDRGETCPNGMACSAGTCYYVYDDPRCIAEP